MSGPTPEAQAPRSAQVALCDEIGRAVGALWQRRCGVRPSTISTEYVGDVVRCTIDEGSDSADPAALDDLLDDRHYEREAQAAVRRLTGRPVMGFTQKRATAGTQVKNAFILARAPKRY